MGPNDADVIRVYPREANGTVADSTLDPNLDASIVVDLEAGSAVFDVGGQWQLGITVKDLDDGTTIPFNLTPTTATSGSLNSPPWSSQQETFTYTIPAANLLTHKGHLCQIHGYLLIGTGSANYDANFVESEPFLVLQ